MKHQLEIKFIVDAGFAPVVSTKTPARSIQPTQTVLVILPDGKVVRRIQPASKAAFHRAGNSSASARKVSQAPRRGSALPRRLSLSSRQARGPTAPLSSRP
jgi:hypothetical protein